MVVVNVRETIEYGFHLMGLVLVFSLIAGLGFLIGLMIVDAAGGSTAQDQNLALLVSGLFVVLLSIATFLCGILGLMYKVIADGVGRAANG